MTSYGNLRRRELRAMPTYQYPQQAFVLAPPDVLVQAGTGVTSDDLSSTSFGDPNYGMAWLAPVLGLGAQSLAESQKQSDAASLAAATTAAQAIQNSNTAAANAATQLAFQKRLPILIVGGGAFLVLGMVLIVKMRAGK